MGGKHPVLTRNRAPPHNVWHGQDPCSRHRQGRYRPSRKRESAKQRLLVHKAKVCETRLLFVASALKQLFADPGLVAILQASKLATLPQFLADHVGRKGA